MFEIFQTFMKRYNVDMGMLHEEADGGQYLPHGEVHNDWVSNILAFVIFQVCPGSCESHKIFYFREM